MKTFKIKQALFALLFALILVVFGTSFSFAAEKSEVPLLAEDVCPMMVGEKIPDLTLMDINGKEFKLKKAFKKKPTLLIFYRGSWCPYCNTHLADLRKIEDQLVKMGVQIIAISPDLPAFLKETVEKNKLGYQLVSDSKMQAAKALGLAFRLDDDTVEKYKGYKIDLTKQSGEDHQLLPVPAAILVKKDGTIAFSFVAPNYKVRVENEVILAAAKALVGK